MLDTQTKTDEKQILTQVLSELVWNEVTDCPEAWAHITDVGALIWLEGYGSGSAVRRSMERIIESIEAFPGSYYYDYDSIPSDSAVLYGSI